MLFFQRHLRTKIAAFGKIGLWHHHFCFSLVFNIDYFNFD